MEGGHSLGHRQCPVPLLQEGKGLHDAPGHTGDVHGPVLVLWMSGRALFCSIEEHKLEPHDASDGKEVSALLDLTGRRAFKNVVQMVLKRANQIS